MADQAYCIYCGSPFSGDVSACPKCGKAQEENLFKVWLWKNTKEKLRGDIDDSLFEVVKNWLISRLYGLILLLTVMAAVSYVIVSRRPFRPDSINIDGRPVAGSESQAEPSGGTDDTDLEGIREDVYTMVDMYKESVFYWTVEDDPYIQWGPGGYQKEIPERYEDYRMPEQYGTGRHEYVYDQGLEEWDYSIDKDSFVYNDPSTELGKSLRAQGFNVAEMKKHDVVPNANGSGYAGPGEYLFVLVQIDGVWYVAEDFAL